MKDKKSNFFMMVGHFLRFVQGVKSYNYFSTSRKTNLQNCYWTFCLDSMFTITMQVQSKYKMHSALRKSIVRMYMSRWTRRSILQENKTWYVIFYRKLFLPLYVIVIIWYRVQYEIYFPCFDIFQIIFRAFRRGK